MPKQLAVIFDLDGTLCSALWRDHLWINDKEEWGAAIPFDKPIADIYNVLHFLSMFNFKIIYLTGRPEKFRLHTLSWLHKYNCPAGDLFMRPHSVVIRNAAFKKVIYETEIKKLDLDIMFAIDDNPEVIEMWKTIGILTIHVINSEIVIPEIFLHPKNT